MPDRERQPPTANPRDPAAARRIIRQFVRSIALRRRLFFLLANLAGHALAVGVLLYLVDWAYPSADATALWTGIGWLVVAGVWCFLRRGMSLQVADGALDLQDRLTTWWSIRDRRADAATRWLTADLSQSLAALPEGSQSLLWRRPARRLLWLVPMLLAVWAIGPLGRMLLLPSPYGVTEEDRRGPTAQRSGPGGKGGDQGRKRRETAGNQRDPGARRDEDPQRSKHRSDPPRPDAPRPDAPEPPAGSAPASLPPKPIPPMPATEEFVVPTFVGAGDGRKQKSKVAVIEETEDGRGRDSTAPRGGSPEQTERQRREFAKAEELALRARYVPERERAFVKRYFTELLREPPPGKRR